MSGETTTSYNSGDIEDLLASVDAAMDRPYALSEPQASPPEVPAVDRETVDREQADWNNAMYYPNPNGLPISAVVRIMQERRKSQEDVALAQPYVPPVIRPGAIQTKLANYTERGLL